ncbi:hypothetical protein [Qaidamihabitans albus]|uniref:hypothetical protein n=1 Tax=Qaidamihabitans albus TaxID=2795733 RepID=UPI001F45531E|nr:hypothetical protein [Qaidamihabitans albus]
MGDDPDFYRDKKGRLRVIPKKGATAVTAAALAGVVAFGTGGLGAGGAAGGGAADTIAGQSIRAKTVNGKSAARKGQRGEAWRRMGMRSVRHHAREAVDCVRHSFGQVQEFFIGTPCRSLRRELLAIADDRGNTIVVSIAWVRMYGSGDAARLRGLIDVHGTGDITPIGSQALGLGGIEFTGDHYGSRRSRSTVVIAEAEPATGAPDPALLDGVAEVAALFPAR